MRNSNRNEIVEKVDYRLIEAEAPRNKIFVFRKSSRKETKRAEFRNPRKARK